MAVQDALRLANHLARDTRLIIYPLLQHEKSSRPVLHAPSHTPISE
jgi:hypothetical protein